MITALAGSTEINLVVKGKYTVLDMGPITDEIVIAVASTIIVAACLHYHVKGAFCVGLMFGTFTWWIAKGEGPEGVVLDPEADISSGEYAGNRVVLLVFNLFFLYILTLNGLARGCSDLGGLTKKGGKVPRGNALFIVCGAISMLSGYFSGPPILISPESAAGIKAGAKTGLSTVICGILFGIATFFSPIFAAVPAAGTAPLLIMVGVLLFNNTKRVDWTDFKESVPAYFVLFYIPFTYSILRGVAFGYIIYAFLMLFTGEWIPNSKIFIESVLETKKKVPTELNNGYMSVSSKEDEDKTAFGKIMAVMDMGGEDSEAIKIQLH
jgi:adenine/guanine/hypoxanthine permease